MSHFSPNDVALVIIAKTPVSGQVKTRLVPAVSFDDAAELACAALADTIDTVKATPSSRRVLLLEGEPDEIAGHGLEVIRQRTGGLGERLAGAFADVGGPAIVIAMDTPQVSVAVLETAQQLLADGADAVYGPAEDGGYWLIGLANASGDEFDDVPMSLDVTGSRQLARLDELGRTVKTVPTLVDVDTIETAQAVSAHYPDLHFSQTFRRLMATKTPVEIKQVTPTTPLVELIAPGDAPLLLRGVYDGGDPGPIAAALAQVPELCLPTLSFVGAALGASAVPVRQKEMIILRTSVLLECKYCVNAHTVVAIDTGLSIDEAKALRNELPLANAYDDPAERALLDFIDAMATGRGPVSDSISEAMTSHFSAPEIVEFSVTIGATMFLNRFATGLGLPTDAATFARLAELGLATKDDA